MNVIAADIVRDALSTAVDCGEVGVQVAAFLRGWQIVEAAVGQTEAGGDAAVDAMTLFPVFSVTKAITATALHVQADRGLVDYDAPVAEYWPEYALKGKGAIRVRHVLRHQAGVPQMPEGVTPERLCDWDGMIDGLCDIEPLFPPGEVNCYHSHSFGWLIGEIVRRTDPQHRPLGAFVREEICGPLGIHDLWLGIPAQLESRVAKLSSNRDPNAMFDGVARLISPPAVATIPEIYNRPDLHQACLPAAGGIMTASSCARFWAMLANGGKLGEVRLLRESTVASFTRPRPNTGEPDLVFGYPIAIGDGGFWLGHSGPQFAPAAGTGGQTICHPGAGGSIGWADLDTGLAAAICHNRMFGPVAPDQHPFADLAKAVRTVAGA